MRGWTTGLLLAALLTSALSLGSGRVRADPLLQESTALAGPVTWLESGAPGMVLVVVRGADTSIQGYGETARGNKQEPDARSLFRLGSITKVFTTEVLGALTADGTVRLTDPLQHYAGQQTVPIRDGQAITLLDLATHTAGLPRDIGFAPEKPQFTWPTRAERWAWLQHHTLGWMPGSAAAYSNVGFDLLADALETASGQDYPALLAARVTAPVGMSETGFTPTPAQCARLMLGTGIAPAAPCLDTHASAGSGGLYSTGADMARWLRHLLDDAAPALLLSHAAYRQRQDLQAAIGFDEAGTMSALGLGWVIMAADGRRPLLLQKTGGGAGFMSYIAFAPGRGVGAFVVVSRVDFGMFAGVAGSVNDLIANLATR